MYSQSFHRASASQGHRLAQISLKEGWHLFVLEPGYRIAGLRLAMSKDDLELLMVQAPTPGMCQHVHFM